MSTLIILFGLLVLLSGIVLVVKPNFILGFLRKNHRKPIIHIVAVIVRLILGALLVSQADASRFPTIIAFLGWLMIVAALLLLVMGRRKFRRLLSWALKRSDTFIKFSALLAVIFGGFLIYAFV